MRKEGENSSLESWINVIIPSRYSERLFLAHIPVEQNLGADVLLHKRKRNILIFEMSTEKDEVTGPGSQRFCMRQE